MEKRVNCEALISGKWYRIPVSILREYQKHKVVLRRCPECHTRIKLMSVGRDGQKAHFEHERRNSSCSESVAHGNHEKYGEYKHTYIKEKKGDVDASYDYKELLLHVLNQSNPVPSVIDNDIEKILNDDTIGNTEKSQLISIRIGQGQFRRRLIDYWEKCAVTGISNLAMLLASHIKPWAKCNDIERLDIFNGLLLSPNLDRAFDQGLISFSDNGELLLSSSFEFPGKAGINTEMKIELELEPKHLEYLAFHRENVFRA